MGFWRKSCCPGPRQNPTRIRAELRTHGLTINLQSGVSFGLEKMRRTGNVYTMSESRLIDVVYERPWRPMPNPVFFLKSLGRMGRLYGGFPKARYTASGIPEDIISHMEPATCSVIPSRQDNCPTVVLEAMAAGIPCIGSEVGGIPFLIEAGKTGLLFRSDDVDALSAKLLLLHTNPSLAAEFSIQSKCIAIKRFSSRTVAAAHVEMYCKVFSEWSVQR